MAWQIGKEVLPRARYKNLDDLSDVEAEDLVQRWGGLKAVATRSPKQNPVREPNILRQLDRYLTQPDQDEGRHPTTMDGHRRLLADYALPYSVNKCECRTIDGISDRCEGVRCQDADTAMPVRPKAAAIEDDFRNEDRWQRKR